MAARPCINPNCNSCGKPHPHCRCFGFAEGGEIPDNEVQVDPDIPADEVKVDPEIPDNEVVLDDKKPSTTGQQIGAGVEGVAQGLLGPVATALETHPLGALAAQMNMTPEELEEESGTSGVPKEDIAARQAANPVTHAIGEAAGIAGSMLYGVGEAGLITKGAKALAEASTASKIGAGALKLAIEGASFAGSDEITKSLLGQGDPETPVATALLHMGANALVTAAGGGLFNVLGKGLGQIGNEAMVAKADAFLRDLAKNKPVTKALEGAFSIYRGAKHGGSLLDDFTSGGATYTALKGLIGPALEKIIGKPLTKANQYVGDAILSALSKENPMGVHAAMQWGNNVGKGAQKMIPAIESIFKGGSSQVVPPTVDALKKQLKENIEEGTVQQSMQDELQGTATVPTYAKGGTIEQGKPHTDHFGVAFPEQNILLNQAKGRISTYLNSIRPLHNPKLPFDEAMHDAEKHRSYDKALGLAVNPLEILNHVQKGDLTPEHMKHFVALYPEVHRLLARKLTERILHAQLNDEKPKYGKRQALSLFLGAELDSSMTPQAIQAVQGVFAQKQTAQQQQVAPKKGKASLNKLADAYRSDDQAIQSRQQKV